jgi:hypothetical protein
VNIAALYVDSERGPYRHIEGVELWDKQRDARLYKGPHPVVAHPPCQAWGGLRIWRRERWTRYAWTVEQINNDAIEASCGPFAVESVRAFGGVMEHPAGSFLWEYCNLPKPGCLPDRAGGFTVEVDQGNYGHPCPKRTWLYIVGPVPLLITGKSAASGRVESQSSKDRHLTPRPFARLLVAIASSCMKEVAQ